MNPVINTEHVYVQLVYVNNSHASHWDDTKSPAGPVAQPATSRHSASASAAAQRRGSCAQLRLRSERHTPKAFLIGVWRPVVIQYQGAPAEGTR